MSGKFNTRVKACGRLSIILVEAFVMLLGLNGIPNAGTVVGEGGLMADRGLKRGNPKWP